MKISMFKTLSCVLVMSSVALSGCQNGFLKTRGDLREVEAKKQTLDQVSTLQRSTADMNGRFAEIEDDLRRAIGRVEVLEARLAQGNSDREKILVHSDSQSNELNKKILVLQEEISRLDGQIAALTAESQKPQSSSSGATKKNDFDQGEEHFESKEWRRAILSYQKYRDGNPKGKNFADATYKIGVSFQELGLKDEAKTFYDEVIAKHPKSSEAKRAKTRLSSLKK